MGNEDPLGPGHTWPGSTGEDPRRPTQVFAERLRAVRQQKGVSQTDLAQRMTQRGLPMHQTAIAKIEGGQRAVSLDEALLAADVLRVPALAMMLPSVADQILGFFASGIHIDLPGWDDARQVPAWRAGMRYIALVEAYLSKVDPHPRPERLRQALDAARAELELLISEDGPDGSR